MIRHQGKRYIYRYQGKLWTIKSLASFLCKEERALTYHLGKHNTINGEVVRCVGVGSYAMCFEVYDLKGNLVIRGKDEECGAKVFCSVQNIRAAAKNERLVASEYRVVCVGKKHFVDNKEIDYE